MQQPAQRDDALERFNKLRVREVEDWNDDTTSFLARFQHSITSLQPDEMIKLKMTYTRENNIELLKGMLLHPQANKICSLVWKYDGKEDVNSIIPLLLGNCPELGSLQVDLKHHSSFDFVSSMLEYPSNKVKVLDVPRYTKGDLARFFAALKQSQVSAIALSIGDSPEFARGLYEYLARDVLVRLKVRMDRQQVPSELMMSLANCTCLAELELYFFDFLQPTAFTLPKCITKLMLFCCTFVSGFDWSFLIDSNVRELGLTFLKDVDGNQLGNALAVYLKAKGLDKLHVAHCGFVNETLAVVGIELGRIKRLNINCLNGASTKLIALALQSPNNEMKKLWSWNNSGTMNNIENHLAPALKHPNCNLAELILFTDQPAHKAAIQMLEDRFHKRRKLFALLQGQQVRRLYCPLRRLPVDLLSREHAAFVIGELGNQAVKDHIARALEHCQIKGLNICFDYCNLSAESVQLLANALEKNTCVGEFACMENPFNYPNGWEYAPQTDEPVKQAIIRTNAPISRWNYAELSSEILEAKRTKLPVITTLPLLDAIPDSKQVFAARRGMVVAEQVFEQKRARFETTVGEREKLQQVLKQVVEEVNRLKQKQAELDQQLELEKAQMETARVDLDRHQQVIEVVDEVKRKLGLVEPTSFAAAAGPTKASLASLCQICLRNKKTRCLYMCGHQACEPCVLAISNSTCPFCQTKILDVIVLFELL
ncbi:hypothetical protein BASA81_008426 [Batrachochytrium salamandrivorans]|nr:hypothetical protein BASA81_008426 [Batrachochytrium salamandrivorans]